MRTLMSLVAALACTLTVAYGQDTPPDQPAAAPPRSLGGAATPGICPNCGHRLRQAAGWRRTFGEIAEDLEDAAAEGGADGRIAGMLARAVRIMEADATTGDKLHEWLDPRFLNHPGSRAPYRHLAEVLSSREVTAGLPLDVVTSYEKLGRLLLDDGVSIDLSRGSEFGEWSSLEQIIRTLNAIADKYAPRQARARREGGAELDSQAEGAAFGGSGRYPARRRPGTPQAASGFAGR